MTGQYFALVGSDETSRTNDSCGRYFRFDPATGAWSSDIAPMSHDRSGHAVAALDGSIYVVGGYDPCRNQWASVAPLGTKRFQCSVSVLNGCLYAVGGWTESSAERFDPRVGKWEQIRPMTAHRACFGSAVLGEHLYAAGGHSGLELLGSAENYDPRTNTWTAVADMNEKRSDVSPSFFPISSSP
ncbi:kelch repeat protein [Teladorsagia circumcincta]|uniref:Kelch repeat protein n=1 Tax=Teladorsagia circumcincta TaxID=45464 RepID=A0A2G9U0K3_TELCI|nr:kelch repeat protein [Teladorsagia circumcincta]